MASGSDDDLLIIKDLGRLMAGTKLATNADRCAHLNAAVAAALGVSEAEAARLSWELLLEAVQPDDEPSGARQPFAAARHLLCLVDYPTDSRTHIPNVDKSQKDMIGVDAQVSFSELRPRDYVGQRRLLAALAGGYGRDRTALAPRELGSQKATGPIDDLARSVWAELQALMADPEQVAGLINRALQADAAASAAAVLHDLPDEQASPQSTPAATDRHGGSSTHEPAEKESEGSDPIPHSGATGGRWRLRRRGALVAATVGVALIAVVPVVIAKNWGSDPSDGSAPRTPTSSGSPEQSPPSEASGTRQSGWGPKREMFTLESGGAPYPAFNSISDNPNIGDERDFVGLRNEASPRDMLWQSNLWAEPGDTFVMRIYVNNAGADSNGIVSAGWIQDATVRVGMSQRDARTWDVFAVLSARNATTVWDGAALHVEEDTVVSFDPATAKLENNAHPDGGLNLDPSMASSEPVTLGYAKMNGVIKPGYKYSAFITIKVRVLEVSAGS